MWLIEWRKGNFVNAERIVNIHISSDGVVLFWLEGDSDQYNVAPEFTETFLNNLQALNNNMQNIESRHYELTAGEQ